MFVGEPEDGLIAAGGARVARRTWSTSPEPDVPPRRRRSCRTARTARSPASSTRPIRPGICSTCRVYRLPLVNEPYVIVETSRGCPYSCDFCVAPIHQGHKFRERSAKALVDEIERGYREFGLTFFYLWGDTVTLNVKTLQRVLRGAHRAQAADSVVRQRARRQPHRPGVRQAAAPGRMLDAGARHRDRVRGDAQGHDEAARGREDPRGADATCATAGIRRSASSSSAIPATRRSRSSATIDYAIELDPDFANFYPAVPYPGHRALREGQARRPAGERGLVADGVLVLPAARQRPGRADRDVDAINRAKRRFYLRPGYLARHAGDIIRLASTKWNLAWHVGSRVMFGAPVAHGTPATSSQPRHPERVA